MPKINLKSRIVGHGEEAPDNLTANPLNFRRHPKEQLNALKGSMKELGWIKTVIVNKRSGYVLDGHARVEEAIRQGLPSIPVTYVDLDENEEKLALAVLDPITELAYRDDETLKLLLEQANASDQDLKDFLLTLNDQELQSNTPPAAASLAERFVVPPFTVLDTRQGYWQDRKKKWISLGIESESGRHIKTDVTSLAVNFKGSTQSKSESLNKGISIFDPVVCEIAYRWFCPPSGIVLDPFAGGSVRGVVAGMLGRSYTGLELRAEQVHANKKQSDEIFRNSDKPKPQWIIADSLRMDDILPKDFRADMIFSCPPYADLEEYSDDPSDISNMTYPKFLEIYSEIIDKAVKRLNDDGFIVWVVGEVRDSFGNYYGFISDTIRAFQKAGASFYNEAILVTPVGTVALTTSKHFTVSRKLGKVHQNILVFVKGNPKTITNRIGFVDCSDSIEGAEIV